MESDPLELFRKVFGDLSASYEAAAEDQTSFESYVLPQLASDGQLSAYKHPGFWQPMDTLRDRTRLEEMWASGQAPWKLW